MNKPSFSFNKNNKQRINTHQVDTSNPSGTKQQKTQQSAGDKGTPENAFAYIYSKEGVKLHFSTPVFLDHFYVRLNGDEFERFKERERYEPEIYVKTYDTNGIVQVQRIFSPK